MRWIVVLMACGLGCAEPDAPKEPVVPPDSDEPPPVVDTPEPPDDGLPDYVPLEARRLLVRASLDLRGVRPTPDEVAQVEADAGALDGLIESFLHDPRFGRRVREVFDEVLLIRDEAPFADLTGLAGSYPDQTLWEAAAEEPTRMLERIALEDLPYTDWVTADWTMAHEVTRGLLPTDYPADATGWQVARYTDGRPTAGALVSTGLWWQHGSTLNNQNRGRANQISRIFLCFDYLDSEIDFTAVSSVESESALGDAIRNDPGCAACHDSLDPLASLMYGFWFPLGARDEVDIITTWQTGQLGLWSELGGLPPAFHGEPMADLGELGQRIAADPAYARCFVENSWEGLLRREALPEERAWLGEAVRSFEAGGLHIRDAWRAIVHTPAWRNGEGALSPKVVSPALLSSVIEDLTGFRWTEEGWDLVRAPLQGYGPAAGGIDGNLRNAGFHEPTATLVLVQAQLAGMAASFVAARDLADPAQARLLTRVDGTETLLDDEAALREQIVALHLRILSDRIETSDARVTAELALWDELLAASGEPVVAWSAVISVLLRDPGLIVY